MDLEDQDLAVDWLLVWETWESCCPWHFEDVDCFEVSWDVHCLHSRAVSIVAALTMSQHKQSGEETAWASSSNRRVHTSGR